jgi:serine/threonine-protein kinase
MRSVVWVDRNGGETPTGLPSRDYGVIRLSPDETQIAVDVRGRREEAGIWTWDISRSTMARLTFDQFDNSNPVWSADGKRIVFRSNREGAANLFWQFADGHGSIERLTSAGNAQIPKAASNDGKYVFFTENVKSAVLHIGVLNLATRRSQVLITSDVINNNPDVSPDGRWIAYQSTESGRPEIYVRPFPNVNDGRWQVSFGGGSQPLWGRDGRHLYYHDGEGLLSSVDVRASDTFTAGVTTRVLKTRYAGGGGARTYDVSRDGRFLVLKDSSRADDPFVVVLNWMDEVKKPLLTR